MSEPIETAPEQEQQTAEVETFDRKYVEKLREENAKYRTRATEQTAAAKAADQARLSAMSDGERAVAEAETRGRSAAVTEYGQRLARAEFVAAAARRNPGWDATAVLDDLNLARYITEAGEPDTDGLIAAVSRLVPEPVAGGRPVGNADIGTRGAPVALNGDGIEDALRAKLGIA